jgi:glycosyltransferase involved in cell wall biosynthesis
MKILFIHQNFPGQFKFLAPALSDQGHEVVALTMSTTNINSKEIKVVRYQVSRASSANIHPWIADLESKTIRAEGCFRAAYKLKQNGFVPDIVIAHSGWGESLFIKNVWPNTKLGIYCEFYYNNENDIGFDPEFPVADFAEDCRLWLKNINNILHFDVADAGLSPTQWQASTFPQPFRDRITVIHDGIDTVKVKPNSSVSIEVGSINLSKSDEIITFVNRNLEPYRGYHTFMRCLPGLLKKRPKSHVFIVGGDKVSYGAAPPDPSSSWKEIYINEIRPLVSDSDWSRVHFLGNIPYSQFIPLLQLSTVHVYLTYPFILSWSLLEAMSAGCSIVASNTKPLLEAIKHEKTGLLVDFFDAIALENNICRLLDDAELRNILSNNARSYAIANYDVKNVCLPQQLQWVEELFSG